MQKKLTLKCGFLLSVAILSGAWTFEVIDKPGSEYFVSAQQARDAGDNAAALSGYEKALEEALDYQTRAKAMTQIASIYLSEEQISTETAQKSRDLLVQAEELGYPRASLALGDMYRLGQGVEVNYETAFVYYNKVSTAYPDALISMAEMVTDPQLARDYIAQASDMLQQSIVPSASTAFRLARHFRDGKLVVVNPEMALYWYQVAVQGNSVGAMMDLAEIWKAESHQPASDMLELWKRASDLGVDRATLELGFAYAGSEGVVPDKALADQYFTQAAEKNPDNAYRIARWYEERIKQDKSYAKVYREWLNIAADKGQPDALLQQARAYWTGKGAPQNFVKARELYLLAAKNGSEKARSELAQRDLREQQRKQKELARLTERERKRTEQADAQARKRTGGFDYWLPLSHSGDAEAMLRVGEAYVQGNGVTMDAKVGGEWIVKSAQAGNGEAMYALAQLYAAGVGVSPNMQKTYAWYERSARAGYPAGQYQLGLGYARGVGVERNEEKAREWLEKASANGYSAAAEILENLKGANAQ